MNTVVIAMPGNETLAHSIASKLGATVATLATRRFPDHETYLRFEAPVPDSTLVFVCTLDHPDEKFLPLIFACGAARELGARRIILVAPYLAYMRQDVRFRDGEAVTSRHFAQALSPWIDTLLTIDPHLHRIHSLTEIYPPGSVAIHAGPAIAKWISANIERPVLIGPDEESEQWVGAIARLIDAPHVVSHKTRRGDKDVVVDVPDLSKWQDRRPVIVDDIISSGKSMIETARAVAAAGMSAPACIGVHGLFGGSAHEELLAAGVSQIVTCNTVVHPTNDIDISGLIAEQLRCT
jgi:ribose-phosphate pyrophosphokinase